MPPSPFLQAPGSKQLSPLSRPRQRSQPATGSTWSRSHPAQHRHRLAQPPRAELNPGRHAPTRMRTEATPQLEVTAAEVADELQRGRCRNVSEAVGVLQLTPRILTSVREEAG